MQTGHKSTHKNKKKLPTSCRSSVKELTPPDPKEREREGGREPTRPNPGGERQLGREGGSTQMEYGMPAWIPCRRRHRCIPRCPLGGRSIDGPAARQGRRHHRCIPRCPSGGRRIDGAAARQGRRRSELGFVERDRVRWGMRVRQDPPVRAS